MTIDEFFAGYDQARDLFESLRAEIEALGALSTHVSKSQIAFRRKTAFAWAWVPDRYLGGGHAPLVLSLSFPERDDSPRWKEIVQPSPGRFMHHLELRSPEDLDDDVRAWLRRAWQAAA